MRRIAYALLSVVLVAATVFAADNVLVSHQVPTCAAGQTLVFNGTSWRCGPIAGFALGAAGTCALPPYSFAGDTDTGVCSIGADQTCLASGGRVVACARIGTADNGLQANSKIISFAAKTSDIATDRNITIEGLTPAAGCGFPAGNLTIYSPAGCAAGGGNFGGTSGAMAFVTSPGGASDGVSAAGSANTVSMEGGMGGAGSGAVNAAHGGPVLIVAGPGGAGGATSAGGNGRNVELVGGAGGTAGGGGAGGNAGGVYLVSGVPTGAGTKGPIHVCSDVASPLRTRTGCASVTIGTRVDDPPITLQTDATVTIDGDGSVAITQPNVNLTRTALQTLKKADSAATVVGREFDITGSNGGAASGATPAGVGGAQVVAAGNGGAGSGDPAGAAGTGGALTSVAGNGGGGTGAVGGGAGGVAFFLGGTGGAGSAVFTAAGSGGVAVCAGGSAGTNMGGGGAAGGDLQLRGGPGSGAGANGNVLIGNSNTGRIIFGNAVGYPPVELPFVLFASGTGWTLAANATTTLAVHRIDRRFNVHRIVVLVAAAGVGTNTVSIVVSDGTTKCGATWSCAQELSGGVAESADLGNGCQLNAADAQRVTIKFAGTVNCTTNPQIAMVSVMGYPK